jgi:tRNA-dihydrouridine synthase B
LIVSTLSRAHPRLRPFYIADIPIDPPLTLAPMAGHTHYAFRSLVREQGGCGLVCTELISSEAFQNRGRYKQAVQRFDFYPHEFPIAVQLFGSDPYVMAEAAKIVVDHGAAIVDINMGCWVPKVAKKGAGAALLRDVCTAAAVVEAVVKAVPVPVTVKVRSGFEDGVVTAVPFAKAAEQCGVKAIAVHARFAGQGHSGNANWDVIRRVKETVTTMPVIGNGDVRTPEDAARMLQETGCDGVMIGRAALGQPWIFRHVAHYLETGERLAEPTRAERAAIALEHARRFVASSIFREEACVLELRGQISKYQLDDVGSAVVRNRIVRAETLADLEAILQPLIDNDADA